MRQSKKLDEIHAEALQRFNDTYVVNIDGRRESIEDRRFYSIAGAMWEGALSEQFENKPMFEVNKIHLSIIKIFSDCRNNRISVDFTPKDGSSDKLSDTLDGLHRADEQYSNAEEAYDNAREEGVGGGIGGWRYVTKYEDEYDDENNNQRICIEPIYDADSCLYFDQNSKRQDKSDAKYAYLLTALTKEAYAEEYDDDFETWPQEIYKGEFEWVDADFVYVAEYYVLEDTFETYHYYEDIDGEEERYTEEELADGYDQELIALGGTFVRKRKIKERRVHKYILSGGKVLEDLGFIAGKNIPLVPYYGKRWVIDGVERFMGHVRLAKDAQRLKNMQLSKLAEHAAYSGIEKPILTPEQIKGHTTMWSEDNVKEYPYLLVNPTTDAEGNIVNSGPIAYTKPPIIPPSTAALLQITEDDIRDILGNTEAGEDMETRISGKAVELIQTRVDQQTFIYQSNEAKAKKRGGEIWLSMAQELYTESGRKMKGVYEDKRIESKELMKPSIGEDGEIVYENDLANADMEVNVEVVPSSDSRRAAIVRGITGMLQMTKDPETATILEATAMMNMEGEGLTDTREFFRKKLVRMGAIEPTEADQKELAAEAENAEPSANDKYLLAEAQKAESEAQQNEVEAIKIQAEARYKDAQSAKIMQEVQNPEQLPMEEAPGIDIDAEKLVLEAEKIKRDFSIKEGELDIKRGELSLKEEELKLKEKELAVKMLELNNSDDEEEVDETPDMSAVIAQAVGTLNDTISNQTDAIKSNGDLVKKKKKVIRENGTIVGIELEGDE